MLGILRRYATANVHPPKVLYTDRDCCNASGNSKMQELFSDIEDLLTGGDSKEDKERDAMIMEWLKLLIRLDIWHFMRRLACGVHSESHPLYQTFMSLLSGCIFKWNEDDYKTLMEAKRQALKKEGNKTPSDATVKQYLTKAEMQRHVRRMTRGEYETERLIDDLILHFTGATDSLGTPLFTDKMVEIWEVERRHVACIQDPVSIDLYTKIGTTKKGDIQLPLYRCARGTVSLESFHSHIVNFIPGTSANGVNFQAYLLAGLARWNEARKEDVQNADQNNAINSVSSFRTFEAELCAKVDALHTQIFDKPLVGKPKPSAKINELFGVEYLKQENFKMSTVEKEVDDGIEDSGVESDGGLTMGMYSCHDSVDFVFVDNDNPLKNTGMVKEVSDEEIEDEDDSQSSRSQSQDSQEEVCDHRGIPGWDKIDKLTDMLLAQKGISILPS
eukprot:TCONS_00037589-protein